MSGLSHRKPTIERNLGITLILLVFY